MSTNEFWFNLTPKEVLFRFANRCEHCPTCKGSGLNNWYCTDKEEEKSCRFLFESWMKREAGLSYEAWIKKEAEDPTDEI